MLCNAHQELALFHRVAQTCANIDNPAGCQRNHRYGSRDIGVHRAGDNQLRGGLVADHRAQRKLLGMIHLDYIQILLVLDLGRWRRFRPQDLRGRCRTPRERKRA